MREGDVAGKQWAWSPGRGRGSAAMRPPEAAPVPILRRRGGRGGAPRQVRFEDPPSDGGAPPGSPPPPQPLAVPVLRSSLWVRGGPNPPEPFDAPRAAAALLGVSFGARCAVGAAAAGATNVPPAQRLFRGLLALSAPPPRPPRRAAPPEPPPKTPGPEPGGAELGGIPALCETPWLPPVAAPPWGPPRPLPRPPGAAFVPYRKLQQWGGGA